MRWGGQLIYKRSRNHGYVYDLDNDQFRIFTLDKNIYWTALIKCEALSLYVPLSSIYIEVFYILGTIKKVYL